MLAVVRVCIHSLKVVVALILFAGGIHAQPAKAVITPAAQAGEVGKPLIHLTLDQAIDLALDNSRLRPISRASLDIAEAQHKQALSSYWPQLNLNGSYTLLDDNVTFQNPAMSVGVPAMSFPISGQTIQLPANAFGPGFPPAPVAIPLPDGGFEVPAQKFEVPKTEMEIWGRETYTGALSLSWPLYTGGMRPAIVAQARAGIDAAKQEVRRSDLQIVYDVRRMYAAALMARELRQIGKDTHERLKATLSLTETMYKEGSGETKKTDYLRNKLTVEGVAAMLAVLESNEAMARAALVNSMGLPWDTEVFLDETENPLEASEADIHALVADAYQFNPDWKQLEAGLRAAEAKIREARSGHMPKVMLTGSLNHIENSLEGGMNTGENQDSWSVGVGMQIPLFSGFRTQNQVREARARLKQLEQQQFMLREGIGTQIKAIYLQLLGAYGQALNSRDAAATAEENRDLNTRAYQAQVIETTDMIEAQLTEAFMKAQLQKALYDHVHSRALLQTVVGAEILRQFESPDK